MKTFRLFALLTTAVVLQLGVFDTQITPARVTSVVLSVEDLNETELSADEGPESTAKREASIKVEPKLDNPQVTAVSHSDTDKGTVRKQSLPDCNIFTGVNCDLVALTEISPSSPNTANPGQVVQGPGNLLNFKLGNKVTSSGILKSPLAGSFEVPDTWTITGWNTGPDWSCAGSAPVSGGSSPPSYSQWSSYAGQTSPAFNSSQNNSVTCTYNGAPLAPGDFTSSVVTFTVTVPASSTRWSSFIGASSGYLQGYQNNAVSLNYTVFNYMTLRYDINGGTGTTPDSKLYNYAFATGNQTAASDSGFSKAGFTFGGWNCDNSIGTKQPGETITWSNADALCVAIWVPPATYQLSYDAGAGSGPVPTTVTGLNPADTPTLAAGTGLTPPANQTFTGWNCDNSIGAKSAGSTATMPAADVICTAQYTPNSTYQLSYNAGAGSGTVPTTETGLNSGATPTLAAGTAITPPANQTFTGWNCDNSIGAKNAGVTVTMPAANVICTAQFTPITYQLSYNAGTGSGTVPTTVTGLNPADTPTLDAGSGLTPPANETFTGWNCDNSIGAKSAGSNVTMPAANVICTAQYTPITYQLSYNAGTGSGTVPTTVTGLNPADTPTLDAGSGLTPPANQTFSGWKCDNSIGAKNAGVTVTMPAANVICTAQYTPITYQLSYNAGTGSGTVPTTETGLNSGATPTLAAGTTITPPANQTFSGWNCDNSIGAKKAGVTVTMPAANVICTAQYTPITTYQLSYNAGAGSGTVPTTETGLNSGATPTLAAGTTITPPANQTFTGWNCDNSIGAKKAGVTVTMPAANVICTAQYTPSESSSSTVVKEATSDNSSGKRGANQILEPLSNDKLTSSSKWKSSSMRLCGPQQSTPNCTRRTLTVEGEGTYVIDTKGRVIFTPEPNFVGNATRVKYQVSDTRGRVVAAAIRISVTDQELPKSGSNSQTMFFIALMLVSLGILQRSILRFRQSCG